MISCLLWSVTSSYKVWQCDTVIAAKDQDNVTWVVTRASHSHHLRTMSLEKRVWALFFFEWEDLISCGHTFSQFVLPIMTSFSCCYAAPHSFFCVMSPKTEWLLIMLQMFHLPQCPLGVLNGTYYLLWFLPPIEATHSYMGQLILLLHMVSLPTF